MRRTLLLLILITAAAIAPVVHSEEVAVTPATKTDPLELVQKIRDTPIAELQQLSFFELNILKNSVFAATGYEFAEDRPWLKAIFCKSFMRDDENSRELIVNAPTSLTTTKNKNIQPWNLGLYEFPNCRDGSDLDDIQKKAVANIRVALFKKIQALATIEKIDGEIDNNFTSLAPSLASSVVMGRKTHKVDIENGSWDGDNYDHLDIIELRFNWKESIVREVHGYNRMLLVINDSNNEFDPMELLGLYVGDVKFLRDCIEAKNGKQFQGINGWEISQIIGIVEANPSYDRNQLPVPVQVKIQQIDEIMKKILDSDLGDIPSSFRGQSIEILDSYPSGAC